MFYHPALKQDIDNFECDTCQRYKLHGIPYGEPPPREAILVPWEEVHVD